MNPQGGDVQVRVGDTVFGRDDHKLGSVVAYDAAFLTVEHGLLRKSHYYVPMSTVNACNDGRVYLNVTKGEIEERAWDAPPQIGTDAEGASLR
jgi:hypothetical protein